MPAPTGGRERVLKTLRARAPRAPASRAEGWRTPPRARDLRRTGIQSAHETVAFSRPGSPPIARTPDQLFNTRVGEESETRLSS